MEEKAKVEIKLLACSRSRSWCEFPNGVKITPSLNSVKLQHSRKDRVISCHQKPGSHENKVCELLRMFKSKGLWRCIVLTHSIIRPLAKKQGIPGTQCLQGKCSKMPHISSSSHGLGMKEIRAGGNSHHVWGPPFCEALIQAFAKLSHAFPHSPNPCLSFLNQSACEEKSNAHVLIRLHLTHQTLFRKSYLVSKNILESSLLPF